MSPDPRARHAKQEGECRLARAVWRHCHPIDVALHTHAERHASASMSLGIRARCDIPALACHSGCARGATSHPLHVARRAREGRHASPNPSPHARVQCDMHRRPCRSSRSPRATCEAERVAPPNRLERHERPGTCRTHVQWSDILEHICRLTRPGRATWTRSHVAAPRMVRRHSLVCGSPGVATSASHDGPSDRERARRGLALDLDERQVDGDDLGDDLVGARHGRGARRGWPRPGQRSSARRQ
jgi:hypothetical protein